MAPVEESETKGCTDDSGEEGIAFKILLGFSMISSPELDLVQLLEEGEEVFTGGVEG